MEGMGVTQALEEGKVDSGGRDVGLEVRVGELSSDHYYFNV